MSYVLPAGEVTWQPSAIVQANELQQATWAATPTLYIFLPSAML